MLTNLQDFICFNQGQLIQYEYLIAKKHTLLKDFLHEMKCNNYIEFKNKEQEQCLLDLVTDLYITCEDQLLSVLEKNFEKIREIFKIEDLHIAIKLIDEDEYNRNMVFSFFDSDSTKVEINSQNASPMNDDIYNTIIKFSQKHFITNSPESIMVIPMTLRANVDLTEEFKTTFFRNGKQSHIWGFLYFGSQKTSFNKDAYINVGHIIADMISLYFIFFHDHTEGSQSFKDALKLLDL